MGRLMRADGLLLRGVLELKAKRRRTNPQCPETIRSDCFVFMPAERQSETHSKELRFAELVRATHVECHLQGTSVLRVSKFVVILPRLGSPRFRT